MKKIIYLILIVSSSFSLLCQNNVQIDSIAKYPMVSDSGYYIGCSKYSNFEEHYSISEFWYQLERYPATNILQLFDLLPSSKVEGNAMIFRGLKQQNFLTVNGCDISDPIFGGFGPVDANHFPAPSINHFKMIEMNPNRFSASNNNNMGMKLDLVPGYFHFAYASISGTIPAFYGSTDKSYNVTPNDGKLNLIETSNGLVYQSSADRNIEFGFNGQICENTHYFISYRNYYKENEAGLEVYDPGNNNLGKLPNQRTFTNNITGSIFTNNLDKVNFEFNGMYGISSWETSSWNWLYATTLGSNNQIPERVAKQQAQNYKTAFLNLKIHNGNRNLFNYKFEFGINSNTYESGRKQSTDPGVFSGFDIRKPTDNYTFHDSTYSKGANGFLDDYETGWKLSNSKDGYYRNDFPIVNPISGYYEWIVNRSANNPYGLPDFFMTEGTPSNTISFLDATKYSASGELKYAYSIFNVPNSTTIGMNYSTFVYDKYIASFKSNSFQYYVNSEKYDAGYKSYKGTYDSTTSGKPIKPYFAGGFIENSLKSEHFQFDFGLRLDYFNSNYESLIKPANRKNPQIYISPRVQMKYNVGSNYISFGYGDFYMMQNLNSLVNYNSSLIGYGTIYSNPYLEPIKTKTIDLSLSIRTIGNVELHGMIYKNWVKNQPKVITNYAFPTDYLTYSSDNSELQSQGLELVLSKYFNDNFDISMNYSYTLSETKISYNTNNFPTSMIPSSFMIPHKLNLIINLKTNKDEGVELFGIHLFENFNLAFISKVYSGYPYTKTDMSGRAIGEENSLSFPTNVYFDFRLSKKINLGVTSKSYIAFSIDVFNLFNSSFQTAKEDYSTLLLRRQSDFSTEVYYEKADIKNPNTFSVEQYDKIGNRYYSKVADYNSDGMVTQEEMYISFARYVQDRVNLQTHMSALRSVFFNITIGF